MVEKSRWRKKHALMLNAGFSAVRPANSGRGTTEPLRPKSSRSLLMIPMLYLENLDVAWQRRKRQKRRLGGSSNLQTLVPFPNALRYRQKTRRGIPFADNFFVRLTRPSIYIDLMMHVLGSAHNAHLVSTNTIWHGRWILEPAVVCMWESICQYHLIACQVRLTGRYQFDTWYQIVDTFAAVGLGHKAGGATTLVRRGQSSQRKGRLGGK